MQQLRTYIAYCLADSEHRYCSFVKGENYIVSGIRYSNGEVDKTHVTCEGLFRRKNGDIEYHKTFFSKEDCRKYLELKNTQNDQKAND